MTAVPAGSDKPGRSRTLTMAAVLAVAFGVIWAVRAGQRLVLDSSTPNDRQPAMSPLDPNSAPWWELAALPHIGESLARRIVEQRERIRKDRALRPGDSVFRTPSDLLDVPGIGQPTLERIRAYLRFPDLEK